MCQPSQPAGVDERFIGQALRSWYPFSNYHVILSFMIINILPASFTIFGTCINDIKFMYLNERWARTYVSYDQAIDLFQSQSINKAKFISIRHNDDSLTKQRLLEPPNSSCRTHLKVMPVSSLPESRPRCRVTMLRLVTMCGLPLWCR